MFTRVLLGSQIALRTAASPYLLQSGIQEAEVLIAKKARKAK
jgi:hypothetical protein